MWHVCIVCMHVFFCILPHVTWALQYACINLGPTVRLTGGLPGSIQRMRSCGSDSGWGLVLWGGRGCQKRQWWGRSAPPGRACLQRNSGFCHKHLCALKGGLTEKVSQATVIINCLTYLTFYFNFYIMFFFSTCTYLQFCSVLGERLETTCHSFCRQARVLNNRLCTSRWLRGR